MDPHFNKIYKYYPNGLFSHLPSFSGDANTSEDDLTALILRLLDLNAKFVMGLDFSTVVPSNVEGRPPPRKLFLEEYIAPEPFEGKSKLRKI